MKILSWNIWVEGDFEAVKDFLREADADIIGLQEVRDDDSERDVIGFLKELGYSHVFARTEKYIEYKTYSQGPAIFSKFPISASEIYFLDTEDRYTVALKAVIPSGDDELHVFNTQLVHTHGQQSDRQEAQVEKLLEVLPKKKVVVLGDFNMIPEQLAIQKLKNVLVDTGKDTDFTWSVYPDVCAGCGVQSLNAKIDYIFTSKDVQADSLVVGESKASDHLPITVNIEV